LIAPVAGPLGGLSATDVKQILDSAEATAKYHAPAIRLPLGSKARMVIALADLDGTIIGCGGCRILLCQHRCGGVQSAQHGVFQQRHSNDADLNGVPMGTAVTSRTIRLERSRSIRRGSMVRTPGPFFNLYTMDLANPCTQGFQSGAAKFEQERNRFLSRECGFISKRCSGRRFGGERRWRGSRRLRNQRWTKDSKRLQISERIKSWIWRVRLPYFKFPRNPTN